MLQDAGPLDEHLAVTGELAGRGPGSSAGGLGVGPLGACPPLDDVSVVARENDDPTGVAGPVEQWPQVLDRVEVPVCAAGVGTVERVVDRVEHTCDERPAGDVVQRRAHVVGHLVPGPRGVERLLVEQHRGHAVSPGQRLEP